MMFVLLFAGPLLAGLSYATPAQPATPAPPASSAASTLVAFPHPLITEVLFNVPPGASGDADNDGIRSATGDEFVELVNPHDTPISLKGYILTDGRNTKRPDAAPGAKPPAGATPDRPATPATPPAPTAPAKPAPDAPPPAPKKLGDDESRVRFVFPDIVLQPGQVVVVFNGYVGEERPKKDTTPEPEKKSPAPGEPLPAIRLSMEMKSQYNAFGNGGDCVLLSDPKDTPVQCITWGEHPKPPDEFAPLIERCPDTKSRGSIARVGLTRRLVPHRDLPGELKGLAFSPGAVEAKAR